MEGLQNTQNTWSGCNIEHNIMKYMECVYYGKQSMAWQEKWFTGREMECEWGKKLGERKDTNEGPKIRPFMTHLREQTKQGKEEAAEKR